MCSIICTSEPTLFRLILLRASLIYVRSFITDASIFRSQNVSTSDGGEIGSVARVRAFCVDGATEQTVDRSIRPAETTTRNFTFLTYDELVHSYHTILVFPSTSIASILLILHPFFCSFYGYPHCMLCTTLLCILFLFRIFCYLFASYFLCFCLAIFQLLEFHYQGVYYVLTIFIYILL